MLNKAWKLLDNLESLVISHTYKEGNKVTDSLGILGIEKIELGEINDLIDLNDFPHLIDLILQDAKGI